MSDWMLNFQLNTAPDDYHIEFHPQGPTFSFYRREFRRIQNSYRPPDEESEDPESIADDSTPEPYSPPSTSPSPPSSIATMDLEILDMGRDVNEMPVHTPQRRARSLEPSINRLSMDTPTERYRQNPHYPHSTIHTPAHDNAPTPHAMAARRALEDRRMAMFTPGRTRRRSIREQRETPMLILRNLGRALAPTSNAIDSSSSPEKASPYGVGNRGAGGSGSGARRRNGDEDDDELPIDRPRLSLPLDEGSSDDLQPPHSSILEDPNMTIQSIELPRRAISEGPPRRSFGFLGDGDVTMWDEIYGDDSGADPFGYPADIAPHAPTDPEIADLQLPPGVSRESDFSLDMPSGLSDNDQTTFFMRSPVVDDVHAGLNAASPGSDDMPLMTQKRQAEMDKLLQRGQPQDEQQDEQQAEQQVEQQDTPSEDRFPDIGDFASVSSLGDAEMEAITQIDFETFGREPERPGDEWIGYPPGRPRKKKREEDEANAQAQGQSQAQAQAHARAQIRVSAHNIEYPPLPAAFVRQTAQSAVQTTGLANQRVAGEALEALARASEWYFRQLGDDLSAYANHANRRTIEERDVVALMHRQRVVNAEVSLFHLASHNLPRELQQLLRSSNPLGQQPAANSLRRRPYVPTPDAPQQTGSKRKREEGDDGEDESSDDDELVFPEDED